MTILQNIFSDYDNRSKRVKKHLEYFYKILCNNANHSYLDGTISRIRVKNRTNHNFASCDSIGYYHGYSPYNKFSIELHEDTFFYFYNVLKKINNSIFDFNRNDVEAIKVLSHEIYHTKNRLDIDKNSRGVNFEEVFTEINACVNFNKIFKKFLDIDLSNCSFSFEDFEENLVYNKELVRYFSTMNFLGFSDKESIDFAVKIKTDIQTSTENQKKFFTFNFDDFSYNEDLLLFLNDFSDTFDYNNKFKTIQTTTLEGLRNNDKPCLYLDKNDEHYILNGYYYMIEDKENNKKMFDLNIYYEKNIAKILFENIVY